MQFHQFQVLIKCPESYLYHKCNRKSECNLPEAEPSKERVSKRWSAVKSTVFICI